MVTEFKIIPEVDQTQEFIEIANDFSNPLEILREAISNAFDAQASQIEILFNVVNYYGEKRLEIQIIDNGTGMDKDGLKSFFDLGNSLRRGDPNCIGEKGHGTKVYFNSSMIKVVTKKNGKILTAQVNEPFKKLFDRKIPEVDVSEQDSIDNETGTEIIIYGYNNNRRDRFTHEILKDYIIWFTRFGSIEVQLEILRHKDIKLYLKGLNREKCEEINFGHIFPQESQSVQKLFDDHLVKAPDYYCKKIIKRGQLKNFPEIQYEAVFFLEGNRVKQSYNSMLRRPGYQSPTGAYTVQERYGIWLCKDYIPIQRKNEWITYKGSEYTKFHAFINCQELRLTANRSSVDNTPSEITEDIKGEVKNIFNKIVDSEDWRQLEWLEDEVDAYRTTEKEKNDFKFRISKVKKSNIAVYKGQTLVQPERESGVFSLVLQLSMLEPNLLPFSMLDYDTHSGFDVIVKGDHSTPIFHSKLYYVEFKHYLTNKFNHSFKNLHSIICWDTDIKHDDILSDINKEERKMIVVAPKNSNEYTKYFLDSPRAAHKIEVFVLKDYLKQKLKIDFRPRNDSDIC